ncbi:hypothetical protein C8J56DRAFT_960640 [Mycena floridula]|nr:hypothetical protein C8J56DRAFT_960640 [Mycena floridula]
MVQTSLIVALVAVLSATGNVVAVPVDAIQGRDVDATLEARMWRNVGKVAKEVGKEVYTKVGDAALHGGLGPTLPTTQNRFRPTLPKPADKGPPKRPEMMKPLGPALMGNNAQKPSIGSVSQALKDKKGADWNKPQPGGIKAALDRKQSIDKLKNSMPAVKPGVKFDKTKVGKANEAPVKGSKSTGKPGKAKEAPF